MESESVKTPLSEEFARQQILLLQAAKTKLAHCLNQLDDQQIWTRSSESANSIGNLVLHVCGNLRQWAVVPISGQTDRRDRASEFGEQGPIPRGELRSLVDATIDEASEQIRTCTEERLLEIQMIQGFEVSITAALIHTTSHFAGHTHQIILMTRQILGDDYRFHWGDDPDSADRSTVPL